MTAAHDSKPSLMGNLPQEPILGSRAGHLTGLKASDAALVDFPDNTVGPAPAQLALMLDAQGLKVESRATGPRRIKGGTLESN